MATQILELNDHGITLGDAEGIRLISPGFALARDKSLVVGAQAQAQSRLHPNDSHSRYWQELSLDPLPSGRLPGDRYRHLADLAHAHLNSLAAESESSPSEVILSVPASFSRQQLGILLGIAKQTPLTIAGLVDSALIAAAGAQTMQASDHTIVVQQQLHQTLFTQVSCQQGVLKVDSSVVLPSSGSQNVIDSLMQLSTELFIDQCRFNPQHDAATEQLLYNALPTWLAADVSSGSLLLELTADGAVHNAKLPFESLVVALAPIRQRLNEQLSAMVSRVANSTNVQIVLCSTLSELPGLKSQLARVASVTSSNAEQHLASSFAHSDQLLSSGAGSLRKELTLARAPSASLPKSPSASQPAFANESGSLEKTSQETRSQKSPAGDSHAFENHADKNHAARSPHAQLSASAQGVQANALLKSLRINGERIADSGELVLHEGDSLTLSFDGSESTTVDESLGTLTFNLKKLNNGAD